MNEHLFRFIFRTCNIASLEYKGLYICLDSLQYLTIDEMAVLKMREKFDLKILGKSWWSNSHKRLLHKAAVKCYN